MAINVAAMASIITWRSVFSVFVIGSISKNVFKGELRSRFSPASLQSLASLVPSGAVLRVRSLVDTTVQPILQRVTQQWPHLTAGILVRHFLTNCLVVILRTHRCRRRTSDGETTVRVDHTPVQQVTGVERSVQPPQSSVQSQLRSCSVLLS